MTDIWLTILSHDAIIDAHSGQANSVSDKNAKRSPMSFAQQVQGLAESAINDISLHYDSAVDTEHGSGDHWILMAVLDKYGFRTNNPMKAVELAEEILTQWYRLHR